MIKVSNKDTRTASLMSVWCLHVNIFHSFDCLMLLYFDCVGTRRFRNISCPEILSICKL